MHLFFMPSRSIKIICISFLFAACSNKKDPPAKQPDPPTIVDIIIAQPQSISNIIEANGTVVANEYAELHPEISGRITYLNVPEGNYIQQGTVIARINDADLEAQLDKSKVELDLAEKTEERLHKLLDINGVNQADYDAALNTVNGYKADIEYTQALIDKTFIKAPFSGLVGLRQISPGAYVTPINVIATIQQTDKVKVDFTLPEEYSRFVKKGAVIDVGFDAATNKKSKAVVVATEPQANSDTRNLTVRAILQDAAVNAGAFVKVYIDAGADKKAIMVPTNALIPDDKNNQLVLVKNGKASFVNVQTGVRQADNAEITKGVAAGDSIIVTGVLFAKPKGNVQVRSIKKLQQDRADSTGN